MHKITGRFDTKMFGLVIALDKNDKVSKELYDSIKKYYINNMFIQYNRRAAKFSRIVLSSVGDHLNNDDDQDILNADLFLDIEIPEKVSPNLSDILTKAPNWLVNVSLVNKNRVEEDFNILIRKSDGFIIRPGDY